MYMPLFSPEGSKSSQVAAPECKITKGSLIIKTREATFWANESPIGLVQHTFMMSVYSNLSPQCASLHTRKLYVGEH